MPKSALFQTHFRPSHAWLLAGAAVLWLSLGSSGCGNINSIDKSAASMSQDTKIMAEELRVYREYLKTLTEQMRQMSEALVALQKLGDATVNLIIQRFLAVPPTPTPPPGLEDLFPAPAPSPTPTRGITS